MAIRKVARLGHPVLRQRGRQLDPAEIRGTEIRRLIEDMIETMGEYGGIGLAAPQIHESLQLAVIGFGDGNSRYPGMGKQPLTAVINPVVKVLDPDLQSFWEGCLSVPGMRGLVRRPRKIQIDFVNGEAKPERVVAEGFLATVFQHEIDHLNGIVYVDRIEREPGKNLFAFQEEYDRYLVPREEDEAGALAD